MFGSAYLDAIERQAQLVPDRPVFVNSAGESLTYEQLRARSNALACWLADPAHVDSGVPVILYGHKSPHMLVAMQACAKAGHAYVPIDTVYPADRVGSIIDQVGETLIIDTTTGALDWATVPCEQLPRVVVPAELDAIYAAGAPADAVAALPGMRPSDVYYIIFTSGSTGTPKGVEVTSECVDGFLAWLSKDYRFPEEGPRVWFNRAAYSFDLSVTDLVPGPANGDTCFALEGEAEKSLAATFEALAQSGMTDWVSTPSFLDQCLADESFGPALLPQLRRMLFVGETLRPATVREAKRRFPHVRVYNCYGPTESTDFVSMCEITDAMLAEDLALPIGYAMPGVDLAVLDPQTLERKPDGEPGELFIVGHTVAKGYRGRPDLTEAAFHSCPPDIACGRKSYRTGDEVTRAADGLYYFHGRLDLQIKLHGWRIELGDIESVLCATNLVAMACVLPVWRDGVIHHLCACVVPVEGVAERGLRLSRKIKDQLAERLPAYMIPNAFKYLETMPLNNNGKIDRKALASLIGV